MCQNLIGWIAGQQWEIAYLLPVIRSPAQKNRFTGKAARGSSARGSNARVLRKAFVRNGSSKLSAMRAADPGCSNLAAHEVHRCRWYRSGAGGRDFNGGGVHLEDQQSCIGAVPIGLGLAAALETHDSTPRSMALAVTGHCGAIGRVKETKKQPPAGDAQAWQAGVYQRQCSKNKIARKGSLQKQNNEAPA